MFYILKKNLFLLGYSILFFSCASNHLASKDTKWLLIPDMQMYDTIIKNNFEIESIIPIETTDEYLLSYIKSAVRHKDRVIILEEKSSFIFIVNANTGKIETFINRRGQGPGESINIRDIAFDDKHERILVFNDSEKLISFDLKGNFIEEEHIDGLFENIVYSDGNVIFYNIGEGYSCFPYSVSVYNLQSKSWEKIGEDKKVDFPIRGYRHLVKSRHIWFSPVLSSDLYMLNSNFQIDIPYNLDMFSLPDNLKKQAASDPLSFLRNKNTKKYLQYIHSIRETENFLIFTTNRSGLMAVNKNDTILHWAKKIEDDYLGLSLEKYFPHDGDDNRILFIIQPNEWLKRKPSQKDVPEFLKKQIDAIDLNEYSNPILVFYKEKTN